MGEERRPFRRRDELHENRDNGIIRRDRPVPLHQVRLLEGERHAAFCGKPFRFFDGGRGPLNGMDGGAVLGEEHAVAALAVGDRKHARAGCDAVRLGGEKALGKTPKINRRSRQSASPNEPRVKQCSCEFSD